MRYTPAPQIMRYTPAPQISDLIGKTFVRVTGEKGESTLDFVDENGNGYQFYHEQDCCESVFIEDVAGDLSDLVGSPILLAKEVSSVDLPKIEEGSYTWTFYKFATIKGGVTVRWLGTSNGYYSEDVNLRAISGRES